MFYNAKIIISFVFFLVSCYYWFYQKGREKKPNLFAKYFRNCELNPQIQYISHDFSYDIWQIKMHLFSRICKQKSIKFPLMCM